MSTTTETALVEVEDVCWRCGGKQYINETYDPSTGRWDADDCDACEDGTMVEQVEVTVPADVTEGAHLFIEAAFHGLIEEPR